MFKRILLERADFQLIASDLVKYYNLKSKIKFGASSNQADYNWMTDTIRLRSSYSTVKELIITILHEIKRAEDDIQDMTDKHVKHLNEMMEHKEKELMEF